MSNLIRDALGDPIPQYMGYDGSFQVLSNGDHSGVDFSKTKLLRDSFGLPIPQLWDATNGRWTVLTNDGTIVTGVDFSKTKLLRDGFGAAIPQLWDVTNNTWVEQTEISFGGGPGGGSVIENPSPVHSELTDGNDYICFSMAGNEFEYGLIVFENKISTEKIYLSYTPGVSLTALLKANRSVVYKHYRMSSGEWRFNNRFSDDITLGFVEILDSSIKIFDFDTTSIYYPKQVEKPSTGGDVPVWDKPYPDHRELTNGKDYICYEYQPGSYSMMIFDQPIGNKIIYGIDAGSYYRLYSETDIKYRHYHLSSNEIVYNNLFIDDINTRFFEVFECTFKIYAEDKTTIIYPVQEEQPPTGGDPVQVPVIPGVPLGNGSYQEVVTYPDVNVTDAVNIQLTEV